MTKDLIGKVGDKTVSYINSEIEPHIKLSMSLAADINNGVIGEKPKLVYLYEKYKIFKSSGLGVFYPDQLYTYTLTGYPPNTILTYLEKLNEGIIFWNVNETDGSTTSVFRNDSSTYHVTEQPYWNQSLQLFEELQTNVIIGEPYLVVNSGMAIYCSTKIYNSSHYLHTRQKQLIGIAKSNLMLNSIQEFLQELTLIGNGYVILAELNDLVIGASINSSSSEGRSRVSIFDLTDKDAGQLMKDVRSQYGNLKEIPSFFQIYSLGVGYDISKVDYKFLNVHWILYMVVFKSDVEKTTNINSGISVGVAIVVIVFGVVCSFIIGHLVTDPLRFLENQFLKIKTFDLKSCNFNSSKFKEVDSIYEHLFDMVTWLNEFKSFLPENVFNQLKNFEQVEWKPSLFEKDQQSIKVSSEIGTSKMIKTSTLRNSTTSSQNSSKITTGSLFKLGLNYSRISVVNVKLFGFNEDTSAHDLSNIFSKIANGLSTLCKTMQVSDLHIFSMDEYQLTFVDGNKKCESSAIEASLKICKILDNIHGKSERKLCYSIGIFTDMAFVGNVGSNSLRSYSIVGPIVQNARKLATFGQTLDCKILVDSGSVSPIIINQYVLRPVDRLEMEIFNSKTKHLISVHEILRENSINPDEWLYELEQSNCNSQFKSLQNAFVSIFEVESEEANFSEKVRESRRIFQRYIDENPSDTLVANRIIYVLNFLLDYSKDSDNALFELCKNYRTTLHYSINSLSCLNCVPVEISNINFKC
ncbi:predicted protein [Naegleria gruberi]|uniref:Predicted protein n=1 Tax=Naegleria gruberi TaxID=5762 RepID=D2VZ80_NAEGR|nr:uncharacterized protein NAEGRDRAFT_53435 [Naegleria gruberi]EFC37947.1 predicted protein [Naegleria gruberi]|eukprot:XP_002670691.1 predicted protein [Naegleria gruberi strain NEG-M]